MILDSTQEGCSCCYLTPDGITDPPDTPYANRGRPKVKRMRRRSKFNDNREKTNRRCGYCRKPGHNIKTCKEITPEIRAEMRLCELQGIKWTRKEERKEEETNSKREHEDEANSEEEHANEANSEEEHEDDVTSEEEQEDEGTSEEEQEDEGSYEDD